MKILKRKYYVICFWLLLISFLGCAMWYFYFNYHAKNIQERFSDTLSDIYNDIEQKGERFSFIGDSLVSWTDNTIAITEEECSLLNHEWKDRIIVELRNGFFVHKTKLSNDRTDSLSTNIQTHYLYLIKHKYDVENLYLQNTFAAVFKLDKNIDIVAYKTDFPILYDNKNVGYLDTSTECLKACEKDVFIFKLWFVLNFFFLGLLLIRWSNFVRLGRLFINRGYSFIGYLKTNHPLRKIFKYFRGCLTHNGGSSINSIHFHIEDKEKINKHVKLIIKLLLSAILFVCYAIFCIILCGKFENVSFRIFTFTVNYDNILLLIIIVLTGFLLFIIQSSIFYSPYSRTTTIYSKFILLLLIAIVGGGVLQMIPTKETYSNHTTSIREQALKYPDYDRNTFTLLMMAVSKDSTVNSYILSKDFQKAEKYIDKYYLSILRENNHTSVLVFDNTDSMLLQPKNTFVNIYSYVSDRIFKASPIISTASDTTNKQKVFFVERSNNNISYLYFYKTKDYCIFAECLKKQTNKNMNYSLFLDNSNVPSDYYKHLDGYNILSHISLLFFLLCLLFGIERSAVYLLHYKRINLGIKSKILVSLLGSFLISLIVLGIFSIKSIIDLNKQNNEKILKEKTESIALEIDKILEQRDTITNLDLINLSNTFLTDINIFDKEGTLVACSQEDIFNKGILLNKINPNALLKVRQNPNTAFYEKESICKGEFLASYISSYYIINIPFINQQKIMNENINSLVNNFANTFLFWLNIAVVIFVLLSSVITKPLELVKKRMSKINVNIHNDKIEWEKDDEIGELIKSYNLMIDKIEESALLLKQQERLDSWKELSKQVAHDIKNPLTPMKLSIQYLQRLYNDKSDMFDEKWNEIVPSLISQIENISTITQELNSYSKPSVEKEKVDLNKCIITAINLFNNINEVDIKYESIDNCFVMGEEKLFIRIFNNLIKNSMQSLYNKQDGKIRIQIKEQTNKYIVSVEDNGCGIKDEYKDKIFNMQFTTRTNGNGIGLTIVKTLLENYNAHISFHSKENMGTAFFMTFDKIE